MTKNELGELLADAFDVAQAEVGSTAFDEMLEYMYSKLETTEPVNIGLVDIIPRFSPKEIEKIEFRVVGSCSYKLKHLKIENPAANVHNKMVIDGEYYNITYEV